MGEIKENNLIEKSKALVWSRFTNYTAGELRLLEVYLSRINPRDPESATVKFTLKEYRDFLGLKSLDVRKVEPQIRHFLGNVVSIPKDREKGTFEAHTLFTSAYIDIDPQINAYVISISCNPKLRPVFFDIAEHGYVKYRLKYTSQMKSQYSILLYSIMRDWLNMGGEAHEIGLDKLKTQLGISEKEKSYEKFKVFRVKVLDTAVDEINKVSDITVRYEKICTLKTVVALKFRIKLKSQEKRLEADFKDISPQTANNLAESKKAVKRPRSAPYEDIEWESIAPELERASCISIAKMVAKRLKSEYPQIKQSKRKAAVVDTMQGAYKDVLEGREPFPDNPAGYLYSVLNREGVVGTYLPGKYTFV